MFFLGKNLYENLNFMNKKMWKRKCMVFIPDIASYVIFLSFIIILSTFCFADNSEKIKKKIL